MSFVLLRIEVDVVAGKRLLYNSLIFLIIKFS